MHSPREYFHSYLHSLDLDREQLPASFADRLARVLHHYGVYELDRTPALEEAVYRIFLAQPGTPAHLHLVTSLLQQWMLDDAPPAEIADEVRDVLERLVAATQLRYPVVGDLARSARFRWFDQPLVDQARASVLAGVRDEVSYLAAHQGAAGLRRPAGGAGQHPGADRAVPGRADRGRRSASTSRCSRCWPAGTTANTSCTTWRTPVRPAGRS